MQTFGLSEEQATAILEMRLQRLTDLERQKIDEEYAEISRQDRELQEHPGEPGARAADHPGRTRCDEGSLRRRAPDGDRRGRGAVELRHRGSDSGRGRGHHDQPPRLHQAGADGQLPQPASRRQGADRSGRPKEDDFVEHLFVASTHSYILLFTDRGRCYWLKVHEIPQGARAATRALDPECGPDRPGRSDHGLRPGPGIRRGGLPAARQRGWAGSRRRR